MDSALATIWFLILGLEVALYVVFDGADLGIGILSFFVRDGGNRGIMVESISPMWYSNETWLVVAGATLFGAFPLAYGILLNALYIPVVILLFGLILRAVSLEFRVYSKNKRFWESCFGIGSSIAVIGEGFLLGGLAGGIQNDGTTFTGGPWAWLGVLPVLITVGAFFGFVMLGSAYLIMKTEGEFQRKNYTLLAVASVLSLLMFVATMISMPFIHEPLEEGWLAAPKKYFLILIAAVTGFVFFMLLRSAVRRRRDREPLFWSIIIFLCALIGFLGGVYPYLIPPDITVVQAASPRVTLIFMLVGVGVLIPVILVYNLYMQGVFRGKIHGGEGEGY
jgi:cytochrome d ubiquinol oxidase subunit II